MVAGLFLQSPLDHGQLVVGVVDGETLGHAHPFTVAAQDAQTERVKGADPAAEALVADGCDALAFTEDSPAVIEACRPPLFCSAISASGKDQRQLSVTQLAWIQLARTIAWVM